MADRWRQVEELFHRALEREEPDRSAFLDEACAGDEALRRDVESLLAEEAESGFMETPAMEGEARELAQENRPGLEGRRIGTFEILSLLGRGGMGEVWRARDAKLRREVAVKTLPEEFANDKERLARFEREATLLASLNHPNIASIYGLEEDRDTRFLVLELVEGDTLAELLAAGPLPVESALNIAVQIADALEAAHESGVIHRDLKPANIKVTPDGKVKVLDFGLAKAIAGKTRRPDLSAQTLETKEGVIQGTPAYMSPQHVRGEVLDKRTDIWAFGCVLYEMLTGRRPFGGETLSDSVAKILESEPDWNRLPLHIHPKLKSLLRRCLERDPKNRYRDIGDVRYELTQVQSSSTGSSVVEEFSHVARDSRSKSLLRVAVGVSGIAALVFALLWARPDPFPEVVRFQIHAGPESRLPTGPPAISPDGRTLAYTVRDPDGVARIHLRQIDGLESRALEGTEGAVHPFWSPDGRSLAFASSAGRGFKLKRIDLDGGSPRDLADVGGPWHGTWSQTGDILFIVGSGRSVNRVSAEGGATVPWASPDDAKGEGAIGFPTFLADGKRFLVRVGSSGGNSIQLASSDSAEKTMVVEDALGAPILAPTPGGKTYLLFMRGPDLFAQEFESTSGTVRGDAVVLVPNIATVANPPLMPAVGVSPGGVLAYQTGGLRAFGQLTWVDRSGTELSTLPPEISVGTPRLSPDGLSVAGIAGNRDVWVTDLTRGNSTRITFDYLERHTNVVWSPDGSRLAFRHHPDSAFFVEVGGSGEEQFSPLSAPSSWSADGRYLLGHDDGTIVLASVAQDHEPIEVGSRNGPSFDGQFSPAGDYIAFTSRESGRNEIYVQPVPPATGQTKVSIDGGDQSRWRGDGRELFFVSPEGAMMAVEVRTGETFSAGVPQQLFTLGNPGGGYDVRADGQQFLIFRTGVELGDLPINVVVNWWVDLEEHSR